MRAVNGLISRTNHCYTSTCFPSIFPSGTGPVFNQGSVVDRQWVPAQVPVLPIVQPQVSVVNHHWVPKQVPVLLAVDCFNALYAPSKYGQAVGVVQGFLFSGF